MIKLVAIEFDEESDAREFINLVDGNRYFKAVYMSMIGQHLVHFEKRPDYSHLSGNVVVSGILNPIRRIQYAKDQQSRRGSRPGPNSEGAAD